MKIEKIEHSDFDLVEIKNGTPHCKKHGAMNKITKDGFWRCITVSGFKKIIKGNAVAEKHIETVCRAGCKQILIMEYEFVYHKYLSNRYYWWANLKLYPRFWLNECDNPNFKHWSLVCRIGYVYFGIKKI